ncbi:MAG: Spx/MgsR family RNA polymerase-binding regulatory protein [Campylobacterales bacterium]|uniref:arsenate reductase family protein n=1 Tax=Sulfurovum sp. TaxID=1969726 RepID=UPI0019A32EB6|nr:arsenate reductase family protein [Sulfurovum sp.]MBD3791818.1 Spx/MgsR family RNA polymerase-binding regulatory protein [Campylobacterales bacterium]MDD2451277.1 arsenate reductase family protein [Sulfurovum sp.]MDD3499577.1 arsenate reductase family protein [Sulfurovum sp.]MDY0403226.1 arsenate reductase family protein [Sulfurovum sp.]
MIKVYGIKNCDSVRKALKYLKGHALEFEFIDFRETPVSDKEISQWLKYSDINTLFNTRGTTYRTLKLKELNLDDQDKKIWLAKENMLIKRPVIVLDNDLIVGYNENLYNEKLQ